MNIDLSAKVYAEKPARELESTNIRGLKERKAHYDKEPTITEGNRYDKDSDYKNRNTLRGKQSCLIGNLVMLLRIPNSAIPYKSAHATQDKNCRECRPDILRGCRERDVVSHYIFIIDYSPGRDPF